MTGFEATNRVRRLRAATLTLLLAIALVGVEVRGASAVGLTDLDTFLFPPDGAVTGFINAGPGSDRQITSTTDFLCLGSPAATFVAEGVCADASDFELLLTGEIDQIIQNPLASGRVPSAGEPLIFDALFTVTNNGPLAFPEGVLVLFTNVNLEPFPGSPIPFGYPDTITVGLDQGPANDLFEIVALDGAFFYGGFDFGALAVGEESEQVRVRYVLFGDNLPTAADGRFVLPPLSATGFAIPEPGTALLLAGGLAGLAWRSRRAA